MSLTSPIKDITWSGDTRQMIAIADQTQVNVDFERPEFMQAHLTDVLVFCLKKAESEVMSVMFWDLYNSQKLFLDIKNIKKIASCEDHCVLCSITKSDNKLWHIMICDRTGTPVANKKINI